MFHVCCGLSVVEGGVILHKAEAMRPFIHENHMLNLKSSTQDEPGPVLGKEQSEKKKKKNLIIG